LLLATGAPLEGPMIAGATFGVGLFLMGGFMLRIERTTLRIR
jgi:hypothetical protein